MSPRIRALVVVLLAALAAVLAGGRRALPGLRERLPSAGAPLAALRGRLAAPAEALPSPRAAVAGLRERRRLRSMPQWQCACGQRYRVSGAERHRVYWLIDADESDPVMTGRCPNCDRGLPGQDAA